MTSAANLYYGIDMGGTKTELAVFDSQWNVVWKERAATPRDNYSDLLSMLVHLIQQAQLATKVKTAIGIGIPGIISPLNASIFTTNIPCAQHQPLLSDLSHAVQQPIKADNDANCFALSEAWAPDNLDYPTVLGVILGTGLGGGWVINQQVFSGMNGVLAEIGHLPLPLTQLDRALPALNCGCGKQGCAECYLSGRGFEWLYHFYYQESLSAPQIIQQYRVADPNAIAHVERFVTLLGQYFGSLLTLFDPHLVVLGGGLSNFTELYSLLPRYIAPHLYRTAQLPPFKAARYGDSGGARGAALLTYLNPVHRSVSASVAG